MESNNSLPEKYQPAKLAESKWEYTPMMRWLLLLTMALGIVMAVIVAPTAVDAETIPAFATAWALFWGVYLVGFYVYTWPVSRSRPHAWLLVLVVALLFVRYAVYKATTLNALNLIVIPALLMAPSILATQNLPEGREGRFLSLYVTGWFVRPFMGMGRWFGALGSLFKQDGRKKTALIGLAIGIPLAVAVGALLISADSVMGYYGAKLFTGVSAGKIIWRIVLGLVTALLFYSFISTTAEKQALPEDKHVRSVSPAIFKVIIGILLALYLVFACFQFAYLTGLFGLPAGLTYSEYAVSGFYQLGAVALINLVLFTLTLHLCKEDKGIKWLLFFLLIANCVVLCSAIIRLSLYIGAYGLTVRRILPMWFLIFLSASVLLCMLRLFISKIKLLRSLGALLLVWYLALNCFNLDAMVATSILARSGGRLSDNDAWYLKYELSEDAASVLRSSGYYDYIQEIDPDMDCPPDYLD